MDYIGQLYESYYPNMTPIFIIIGIILTITTFLTAYIYLKKSQASYLLFSTFIFTFTILYYYLILLSTVFTRLKKSYMHYELKPFWSYRLAFAGDTELAEEIVLNIIMFLPLGLSIAYMADVLQIKKKKLSYCLIMLLGIACSAAIEILQLLLRRGLFEWDDIINNSIGFLLGLFIYSLVCKNFKNKTKNKTKIKRQNKQITKKQNN